jgi:histidinol-phosphatase
MRNLALDLSLALRLADAADALSTSKYQSSELIIETKPDLTPVTDVDKGIEFMIRDVLSQERPLDLVIGEEFGGKEEALAPSNDKYYWVIDPIDGTKNFVRGVPTWGTLIALVTPEHEVVVGIVSAPAIYRRWYAHKGGGAFVSENGGAPRKLNVSAVSSLSDASISYSDLVGWGDRRQNFIDLQEQIWRTRGLGDFWSHMLVAEGAVDIAVEPTLALWDMAANAIIVEEAGGTFGDLDGGRGAHGPSGVSTNTKLHQQFLDAVNQKRN